MRARALFCAIVGLLGALPAAAQPLDERAVLEELNALRADPAGYARKLGLYRTYFKANLVRLPGSKVDIETEEGVAVVDETIAVLARQIPLGALAPAALLKDAAGDHVAEQSASGMVGHESNDGSEPSDRVRRRGGGAYVSEVIAYGSVDPVDVVRQLIVDDGVADRGHRIILLSPELRFAGVSCGSHPEYRTMCVIEMGMSPDGNFRAHALASAR
jgi:uncharacterized protein YkwD